MIQVRIRMFTSSWNVHAMEWRLSNVITMFQESAIFSHSKHVREMIDCSEAWILFVVFPFTCHFVIMRVRIHERHLSGHKTCLARPILNLKKCLTKQYENIVSRFANLPAKFDVARCVDLWTHPCKIWIDGVNEPSLIAGSLMSVSYASLSDERHNHSTYTPWPFR